MLHLITKKNFNKPKIKLPFIAAVSVPIPFDPLTLATYQAGYLMNYENDIIPGSMLSTAHSQWMDAVLLNVVSKYFQANVNNIPVLINGFKSLDFSGALTQSLNTPFDIFNGLTSYTQLISFQTTAVGTKFLFYRQNAANNLESWILLRNTNKIEVQMTDNNGGIGNTITATTLNNYNDGLPHIIIAQYDQALKQVDLFTDLGEHITANNLLFNPNLLTANNQFKIIIGNWTPMTLSFNPGQIGDVLIYSSILSISDINSLFNYEANRLGIAYVPF